MLEKEGRMATVHVSENFLKLLTVLKASNSGEDDTAPDAMSTSLVTSSLPPGAHTPASLAPTTSVQDVEEKNSEFSDLVWDTEESNSILSGLKYSPRYRLREHNRQGGRGGGTTYILRDIKSENVLLTSTNWVYLVDYAPFKPAYLPNNDPAAYYYYFENKESSTSIPAETRLTVYRRRQVFKNLKI